MSTAIHRFRTPFSDNYQYFLVAGERALVVDPFEAGFCARELAKQNLKPEGVVLTHTHWDHIEGVQGLVREFAIPVWGHPLGRDDVVGVRDWHDVEDGAQIPFAGEVIHVTAAPGHHPAHVVLHWRDVLVVGDVLFLAGCGNPNFGGDVEVLFHTVWETMRALPQDAVLAWGHDYAEKNLAFAAAVEPDNAAVAALAAEVEAARAAARELAWRTLAQEREVNPFLRLDVPAVQAAARAHGAASDDPHDVFMALRRWRDSF